MATLVIIFVVVAIAAVLVTLAGGMDRTRRVSRRTVVRDAPVVRERVVERPVATERVTERIVE